MSLVNNEVDDGVERPSIEGVMKVDDVALTSSVPEECPGGM